MIQAYRRGLLRQTFEHDKRSRLREDILLESLETELLANSSDRRLAVIASVVGSANLTSNVRQKMLGDLIVDMRYNDYIRLGDFDYAALYRFENSSLAATTVYDLISQAGWVTGNDNPDEEDGTN